MFIRPILRGRDIKQYYYDFPNLWLLYIPWHFPLPSDSIQGASSEAEKALEKEYPSVYKYLLTHKEKLSKRNKAETGIRYEWYALQRWGSKYSDDFSKQKIMYGEIVQYPRFYLDEKGEYYPEATTFIMTGDNLVPILLLLNSKITFYIFKTFYAGGGLGSSGIRYKKAFLNNLKLPILNKNDIDFFYDRYLLIKKKGFDNIEKELIEIDKYISKMYGFSLEEYQYIIKSC
ncbi:MAG: TaqI-like C-terminal specificity domain-containing protein [Floccifex porci]|uniref:TaqI-like C-terminal specificity domain-containing protein n=1 Tax=Floccifex porci TaxID=2606629 RepID=UPI003F0A6EC3